MVYVILASQLGAKDIISLTMNKLLHVNQVSTTNVPQPDLARVCARNENLAAVHEGNRQEGGS